MNENNELKNRYLHINNIFESENVAIDDENMAIKEENVSIQQKINEIRFNIQTRTSISKLYKQIGSDIIFGRNDVSKICDISYSAARNLIAKMKEHQLIEEVKGYGKGKYRFAC